MMIMTALTELSAYFTGSAPSLLFAATTGAGLCGAYLFQLWRTTKAIASQQRIPVSLGLQRLASMTLVIGCFYLLMRLTDGYHLIVALSVFFVIKQLTLGSVTRQSHKPNKEVQADVHIPG
jgi:hypothetical protein